MRLSGLLDKSKGHHESARRCLLQSIDWSQARKAKALELRAAIDLVRLEFEAKHLGQGQLKAKSAAEKRLGGMAGDQLRRAMRRQEGVLRGG